MPCLTALIRTNFAPCSLSLFPPHLMQPPASPPLRPPAVNYALPRVLKDVPDVIALTSSTLSSSLIVVYFMAPWCGTCKRADPLYDHASRAWADAEPGVLFTRFDCEPDEKLCEDTFGLDWVPTWKFWRKGVVVGTVEGDWTLFEPMLESLAGPRTNSVANAAAGMEGVMEGHRLRFNELAGEREREKREEQGAGSRTGGKKEGE